MSAANTIDEAAVPREDRPPWITFLVAAAVFFFTQHSVFHTRTYDYLQRGEFGFIATEEEAIKLMTGFEEGKLSNAVAYMILGTVAMAGIAVHCGRRLTVNGLLGKLMLFYIAWCFISLVWAENPTSTLKRLIVFGLICVAVAAVTRSVSDRQILVFTLVGMGAYVFAGLASEIALGTFRPWLPGYRFSGTCHPNGQALDCALLFLAAAYLMDSRHRRLLVAIAVAALFGLILTKSRTSLAAVILAPLAMWSLTASRISRVWTVLALITAVCLLLLFSNVAMPILERGLLMGRVDTTLEHTRTLTGRTELWRELFRSYIVQRPILGYGYNSFWTVEHVDQVEYVLDYIPGNAHNAFMDVLIGLGPIALAVYMWVQAWAIRATVRYYNALGERVYAFFGAVLIFSLIHGLTESTFLFPALSTFLSFLILARLGLQPSPIPEEESLPVEAGNGRALSVSAALIMPRTQQQKGVMSS